MIYPDNFEKKIGFDEIRRILKQHCLSTLGEERTDEMKFETEKSVVTEQLAQVSEFQSIRNGEDDFPAENFFDLRAALIRIRPEGTYLDEKELFDLKRSLESYGNIISFLRRSEEDAAPEAAPAARAKYPALYRLVEDVCAFPDPVARIGRIIDKFGKIKDNASPELLRIRQETAAVVRSISISLRSVIQFAQKEGTIDKDVAPTLRDGRLVLPVAPALKRKIKGIVHDESASGKTVFIEPAEVVEANNRIRELSAEEKREIIRILKEMAAVIRPLIPQLLPAYKVLGEIDFIRAKALYAEQAHAIVPTVDAQPRIDWQRAFHPLLEQSLRRQGKQMVPLDVTLQEQQRILIISGPNAGGKSVCLKTVGLLQYMLQCGMPVPIGEHSRTGLFDGIFIDIGDDQSIENDLSTYSGHLLNMKQMMRHCNDKSLLLIDEFGSGTEPLIGGALAEAILLRFIGRGAWGIITTHYQNLKQVADKHPTVVNGAMLYDRQHMQPLFQLQTGNPGSSFAVEIARQIGIPEEVIADASEMVGTAYIQSEKYLLDIARDKRYWENKRMQIRQQEKRLEQQLERLSTETQTVEQSRKSILAKAKEEADALLKAANARIENTIRTIREAQAEKEQTRLARQELTAFRNEVEEMVALDNERIERKMEQLRQRKQRREEKKKKAAATTPAAVRQTQPAAERPLEVGDYVRIKGQQSVGKLIEIERRGAFVLFGTMRTFSKLDRLERAEKPKEDTTPTILKPVSSAQESIHEAKLHFKPDIDVRGMRGDEAIRAVTYFVDDAVLLGVSRVRILHGTGTGALRTLIREYLSAVPAVTNYHDEHVQFGGSGITVVDLA